ncbi:MAG: bifunctional riboflavin kinase/FAD synthetase [Inquilinus sp.]|nr:bifunctional riboflavin kinase/FAD synthetase [Inquilinus sp.]
MQIFRHHRDVPPELRGTVVAVGNFDGVHRGHQIVIAEATAVAHASGAKLAVLSFEPHPRSVFRPDEPSFRLTPFRIRARLLEPLGVELHVVLHFDAEFAHQSADWFVEEVLVGGLGASHVTIGYDFCFGHNRQGNAETLLGYGRRHGFGVTVVTRASDESGGTFSSSRARAFLRDGQPRQAAEILGRPWEVEGRVEQGDQRGRLLGYPTANIAMADYLRPAYGVYAMRAAVDTGGPPVWHDGVANLGIRPMYAVEQPLLEAHLFDFDDDLYGRHLRVELIELLRPEIKFDGVEALIGQMDRDSAAARLALAE